MNQNTENNNSEYNRKNERGDKKTVGRERKRERGKGGRKKTVKS